VTILGEPLRLGSVLGFALILAGSFLATRRKPAVLQGEQGATPEDARRTGAAQNSSAEAL